MNIIKQFEQYSDKEIIEKIIDGEIALFEILIRRNNPFLYKTGMSYGFTHAATQDLMQDTFISAYLSLSKFENRSSFKTWIIKIMLNNCYQKQHKLSFKNEINGIDLINEKSLPMYSSQQNNDTDLKVNSRELTHVIEHSLTLVPIEYRLVFSLRQINGFNTSETAELLNITESNVKVRLNRAKQMLRKEIEKKYTTEDIFEFNLVYCDAMVSKVLNKIKAITQKNQI